MNSFNEMSPLARMCSTTRNAQGNEGWGWGAQFENRDRGEDSCC